MAYPHNNVVTVTLKEKGEVMSVSGNIELEQAAKELAILFNKVSELASADSFGFEFDTSDGSMRFNDWNNSSCYGEEVGREFNVEADGSIWQPSSC